MTDYMFESEDVAAAMTESLLNKLVEGTIDLDEAREMALEIRTMVDAELGDADGDEDE